MAQQSCWQCGSPTPAVCLLPFLQRAAGARPGLLPVLRPSATVCRSTWRPAEAVLHAQPAAPPRSRTRAAASRNGSYSLEATAILNDAYRILRDPIQRAEYVLQGEGFEIGEQRSKDVPPELLEEVFELNMALDELRAGDDEVVPQLEDMPPTASWICRTRSTPNSNPSFARHDSPARRRSPPDSPGRDPRHSQPPPLHPQSRQRSRQRADRPRRLEPATHEHFSNRLFRHSARKRIVGIDLGTTNSLVAFMDLTGPQVIPGAGRLAPGAQCRQPRRRRHVRRRRRSPPVC